MDPRTGKVCQHSTPYSSLSESEPDSQKEQKKDKDTLVFWLHLRTYKAFLHRIFTLVKISLAKLRRQDYTGISGSQAKGYW